MIPAKEALERLQRGNGRFVSGIRGSGAATGPPRRRQLAGGQQPFAVILGCADSRVPPEILFDQGLGDLFVIRVAGNVVTRAVLGSIEFAAAKLGTRLVVVLGHSSCGAVGATLEEMKNPPENRSPNLAALTDRIRPSLRSLLEGRPPADPKALLQQAVRANIRASLAQLAAESSILRQHVQDHGLQLVAAEYALDTGKVAFFPEPASAAR